MGKHSSFRTWFLLLNLFIFALSLSQAVGQQEASVNGHADGQRQTRCTALCLRLCGGEGVLRRERPDLEGHLR